jgi:hypothetical protein
MPDAIVQVLETIATVTVDTDAVVETVTVGAEASIETVNIGTVGPQGPGAMPRSITIANPRVGDNFVIFYSERETILKQVRAVVSGSSAAVEMEIRYATSRTATGTLGTVPETITNTTIGEPVAIQNMPIPDNNYVWLLLTEVTGVVTELNVSLET